MIHPTALIHPAVQLDASIQVGPYSIVDEHVVIGRDCVLGPHVYLTGHLSVGAGNRFHVGCVIGDCPQDLTYRGEPTRVVIGDDNTFREYVTVHRSNAESEATEVGNRNLFMAHSHVGHNVVIADDIVLSNGALVAGHAKIERNVNISGNCLGTFYGIVQEKSGKETL